MEIRDKNIVLTGAAGGIGKALVTEFLAAGARKVTACDMDKDRLDSIVSIDDRRIVAQSLDVTDDSAVSELGKLSLDTEILVNCHGVVVHESYIEAQSISAFRREMEINYWGQLLMCRAFAPILANNGGGAIINFLSPLAYVTFPFCAAYCASKAACRVLTEAMRAELRGQGTLVMAVCPGAIDTPMMRNLNIPKSAPEGVAKEVIAGLIENAIEIWPGEGAREMWAQLKEDPTSLAKMAAEQLRAPA